MPAYLHQLALCIISDVGLGHAAITQALCCLHIVSYHINTGQGLLCKPYRLQITLWVHKAVLWELTRVNNTEHTFSLLACHTSITGQPSLWVCYG